MSGSICRSRFHGVLCALFAAVLVCCEAGSLGTGEPDAGGDDADTGGEPDAGCGGIVCPPGTECIDDRCQPVDPCRGVTCDPGEVCSGGVCVTPDTDHDSDGFNAREDCDDTDPTVYPGTTRPCTTGCGEGVSTCGSDGIWGDCEHPTNPCGLPHATAACIDDGCVVTACDEGHSNCDDTHSNGCETTGGCGGDARDCAEVLVCVLACSDLVCAAMCALGVCALSSGPAYNLVDCAEAFCGSACEDPSSGACASCIEGSCSAQYTACLDAGC